MLQSRPTFTSQNYARENAFLASNLKSYDNVKSIGIGKFFHAKILKSEKRRNRFLSNLLIEMYGKFKMLDSACIVFDMIRVRNVFSWTLLIAIFADFAYGKEAIQLLAQMWADGMEPNDFTFSTVLSLCSCRTILAGGKLVHALILKSDYASHLIVGTALLNMYAKCGNFEAAKHVFCNLPTSNVNSWTSMIRAYIDIGNIMEALQIFHQMQFENVTPNKFTMSIMLSNLMDKEQGKLFHGRVLIIGLGSDVVLENALLSMYGKCGSLLDAHSVFSRMKDHNVISWNTMIAIYAKNGHAVISVQFFWQMWQEGLKPNKVTFISVLDACAGIASLTKGKEIHAFILTSGFDLNKLNEEVINSIMNLYANCGCLQQSSKVFLELNQPNVVSWNAIISSYARHGHGNEACYLFKEMQRTGILPDELTVSNILYAFSHKGLMDDGAHCFISVNDIFNVTPTMEQFGCMVDLLARVGCLDEAECFWNSTHIQVDGVLLRTLLSACRTYDDLERALVLGKNAIQPLLASSSLNNPQ